MKYLVLLLVLSACGTYHLATRVDGPTGTQRQVDILTCKDSARTWSQRADAQARGFATGFFLPVIGIAVDASVVKSEQRDFFARCMMERGYTVVAGTD